MVAGTSVGAAESGGGSATAGAAAAVEGAEASGATADAGAPAGFHGCEMEATVDARSEHILGYTLSNIGWAKCSDIVRKIDTTER